LSKPKSYIGFGALEEEEEDLWLVYNLTDGL
jgi:hypothetical protein